MRGGGMRMGMERGRGRGMGMGDDLGLGLGLGMGRLGASGFLARAEFALRDPQIRQQLGFSDQQATKLEQEITDFRKAMIQNRANLEIQRIDLRNLLVADKPDRAAVEKKLQMMSAAQLAMQKSVVDFALTLKQEITPEQREKIRQFLRERRQRGMRGDSRPEQRYRRAPGPGAGQRPQPEAQPQPNPPEPPQ
jgi:Spy/CpxP family protein refolding chaperone